MSQAPAALEPEEYMARLKTDREFLRPYVKLPRERTSKTIREMIDYCTRKLDVDGFIVGINEKDNPFKSRKSCDIL